MVGEGCRAWGLQGDGLCGSGKELLGDIGEFVTLDGEVCSGCEMLHLFQWHLPLFVFIPKGKGSASCVHSLQKSVTNEPARTEITCLQAILITEAKTNYVVH